ncbi:MAG: class I SAM-dependent methyltransferase [Halobacteriales archaeon]|nr:class I SAM-dependent methyltransferase [Halobacteriales archaeon]
MKGREWYQAETVAAEYDEKRFSGGGRIIDRREKQAVLDALAPVEGREVLEIACGTGRFTVMLAERGADITGIDISEAMLARGRDRARAARVERTIEFLRGDAARLPFPDDAFDTVFAIRFFHLASTPETFLSEMRRVAAERVVFDTFNARSARSLYNWLLPMGSRLYTEAEVDALLGAAGLSLADASHDFVVPYGVYRQLPNELADPIRSADNTAMRTGLGERLASVSYWVGEV